MIEDFSDTFTVVVLDRILFGIIDLYDSAMNETWSFFKDWMLVIYVFCY